MDIDPNAARIAMQAAVSRWKRFPDDSIAKQLDEADECVQEAALMNKFLPPFLAQRSFAWKFIIAQDIFRAGVKTVRNYAGLVLLHMSPASTETAVPVIDANALSGGGAEAAPATLDEHTPSTGATNEFFGTALSAHERQGML